MRDGELQADGGSDSETRRPSRLAFGYRTPGRQGHLRKLTRQLVMLNEEMLDAVQSLRQTLVFGRLLIPRRPVRLIVHATNVAPNETSHPATWVSSAHWDGICAPVHTS